jgi:hypothetical protein
MSWGIAVQATSSSSSDSSPSDKYNTFTVVAITGITIGITAVGYIIGRKINFIRKYWKECKSETIDTAYGVKCSSWSSSSSSGGGGGGVSWFRVNDVIMGGKSTSELLITGDDDDDEKEEEGGKLLIFRGIINTNGGGFASMRTTENCIVNPPETATTIRIVVKGDGQLWKVHCGLSHSLMDSQPAWSHDFLTKKNEITIHELQLKNFTPQRRGRKVETTATLDLNVKSIQYVGLILSLVTQNGTPNPNFGDGPFQITLHELEFV